MPIEARCVWESLLPARPEAPTFEPLHEQQRFPRPKWQLLEEAKRRKAEQERLIIGMVVGSLVTIVATLCATFWWVRVRRVAKRYKVCDRSSQTLNPNPNPRTLVT